MAFPQLVTDTLLWAVNQFQHMSTIFQFGDTFGPIKRQMQQIEYILNQFPQSFNFKMKAGVKIECFKCQFACIHSMDFIYQQELNDKYLHYIGPN